MKKLVIKQKSKSDCEVKSLYIESSLCEKLQKVAEKEKVSFNSLIVQFLEYGLSCYDEQVCL